MDQTDRPADGDGTDDGHGAHTTRHVDDRADDGALLVTVVEAVAAETGRDPLEMDPLYHALEKAELRALRSDYGPVPWSGCLRFQYQSCDVTVTGDGGVAVTRRGVRSD